MVASGTVSRSKGGCEGTPSAALVGPGPDSGRRTNRRTRDAETTHTVAERALPSRTGGCRRSGVKRRLAVAFLLGALVTGVVVWAVREPPDLPEHYIVRGTVTGLNDDGTAIGFKPDPGTVPDGLSAAGFSLPLSRRQLLKPGARVELEVVVSSRGRQLLLAVRPIRGEP